ncbi:hypothetical protein [Polaromonas hydrogenivorans]|uniref:Transmembrane protein n=1 Tax=Polaromonas hydrogenivorans TaxID=335476 RepID=A0AAU7LT17_9BURK
MSERIHKSKVIYVAWVAFMPATIFAFTFAGLCAWECIAGPWFTFFVAPTVAFVLWLVSVVAYLRWTCRLSKSEGQAMRRFIGISLLWGPVLAGLTVLVLFALIGRVISLTGH